MITKETIEKIITAGIHAPSGGNSQPWEFEVKENRIKVIFKPEKDHPILNVKERGTLIAHGALLENIRIASSALGFNAEIQIFPDDKYSAYINLNDKEESYENENLYKQIPRRTTNRKPFSKKEIPEEVLTNLTRGIDSSTGDISIKFVSNEDRIEEIAKWMSVGDKIMFENKTLQNLFFKEVVWSKLQEKQKGGGLLIDTLELLPPQKIILRLFKFRLFANLFSKIGITDRISKENTKTNSSCGMLCCITVKENSDFLEVGRMIEGIWLRATEEKLSVHLNTGLLFFNQYIQNNMDNDVFSDQEKSQISKAYNKIKEVVGLKDGIITAVLRIGYDGEPSSKSLKPEPVIKWL